VTEPDPRDADDVAWLEARERGAAQLPPIDPARADAYRRVAALIAALPDDASPAGWQDEVMALLPPRDQLAPRRSRRAAWAAATAAIAAAAALVLWLQIKPPPPPPREPIASRIVPGGGVRGLGEISAALGDLLVFDAAATAGGELRIYRDDREVVVRCPGDAACGAGPDRIAAVLRVTAPGQYRAVYLPPPSSGGAVRAPTGTLDGDVAACGCTAPAAVPIVVR
jgi:hypothetical protein